MAFGNMWKPQQGEADVQVDAAPEECISALSFSRTENYLAVSSWDGNISVYMVSNTPSSLSAQRVSLYAHNPAKPSPVFDVCWAADGSRIFSAGADGSVQCYSPNSQQTVLVGSHDASVRHVRWIDAQGGILASGSWDKTIKYWDTRQQNPIAVATLPERCYALDAQFPLLVCGTAERHICEFDLRADPSKPQTTFYSPLRWQTTSIACSKEADSYAIGSIEGRLAVQYVPEQENRNHYTFRCHRVKITDSKQVINAVKAVAFHQKPGICATAGGESITFWNCNQKDKYKNYDNLGPVSSLSFNNDSSILAYGISYDWRRGQAGAMSAPNKIMLHRVTDDDLRKPAGQGNTNTRR